VASRRRLTSKPSPMFIGATSRTSTASRLSFCTLYDYEQERGTLYTGDGGWEHPHDVVDGKVPGLMLNHPEQTWLSACWEASGALKAARAQIREE
jgi:hypothetical protein